MHLSAKKEIVLVITGESYATYAANLCEFAACGLLVAWYRKTCMLVA